MLHTYLHGICFVAHDGSRVLVDDSLRSIIHKIYQASPRYQIEMIKKSKGVTWKRTLILDCLKKGEHIRSDTGVGDKDVIAVIGAVGHLFTPPDPQRYALQQVRWRENRGNKRQARLLVESSVSLLHPDVPRLIPCMFNLLHMAYVSGHLTEMGIPIKHLHNRIRHLSMVLKVGEMPRAQPASRLSPFQNMDYPSYKTYIDDTRLIFQSARKGVFV